MSFLPVLLIGFLLLACGDKTSTEVEVVDVNRVSGQALDSAAVLLLRYHPGQAATPIDTHWTDTEGIVSFTLRPESGFQYEVQAQKAHFQAYLLPSGGQYAHEASLQVGDTNRLTLQLEPIAAPDPERYTRMHADISVVEVAAAIRANQWTWTFLPRLRWQDIPALLELGQDTTYLSPYPHHPRSRYQPDSVRAGLTALWLIEAIRRQIGQSERPGALMPPSRAPVLGTRRGNPSGYNSLQQMQQAQQGYQRWYERYQEDSLAARRQNPLRGLGMSWM